jgi:hypothetical protein
VGGIFFLTLNDLLRIHSDQIARYGGSADILNISLIESALMQPQAAFGGDYLHADIAARTFSISRRTMASRTETSEPARRQPSSS